jgi:hypothetical protein
MSSIVLRVSLLAGGALFLPVSVSLAGKVVLALRTGKIRPEARHYLAPYVHREEAPVHFWFSLFIC